MTPVRCCQDAGGISSPDAPGPQPPNPVGEMLPVDVGPGGLWAEKHPCWTVNSKASDLHFKPMQ